MTGVIFNEKNFFFTIIFTTIFSGGLVSAAPVTDLNLFLASDPPFYSHNDINFGATWNGTDVTALYWQFEPDANTNYANGTDANYNFNAANGTSLNSLYGWTLKNDTTAYADTNNNAGEVYVSNNGVGGTATVHDDLDLNFNANGDAKRIDIKWKAYELWAGSLDGAGFGVTNQRGLNFGSNNLWLKIISGGTSYQVCTNGSSSCLSSSPLTTNHVYSIEMKRISSGIYDWNVLDNGSVVRSGTGTNLGKDSFHFFVYNAVGGVGYGVSIVKFDDVGITQYFSQPMYETYNYDTFGEKTVQLTVQTDVNVSTSIDLNVLGNLPYDLNLYAVSNPPYIVNDSIDFNVSWLNDGNVVYWQFEPDSNKIIQLPNTNVQSDSESYTYTTPGEKTVQATIQNEDGNTSTSLDLNVFGSLRITVLDENNYAVIPNATIDFNNGTYTTSADGNISIPLSGINAGKKSITIMANGYQDRTFSIDMNQFSVLNENLLLIPTAGNLTTTIYTIDNQNNRQSLPNVQIDIYKYDVDNVPIFIQSQISDSTGVIIHDFIQNADYELKVYYDDTLKLDSNITINSSNLFIFVETGTTKTINAIGSISVDWGDRQRFLPLDSNFTINQILSPNATTIGDVNVIVWADGIQLYNTRKNINSSSDYNLFYDFNASTISQYTPLTVQLKIFDSNGNLLIDSNGTYSIVSTTTFNDVIRKAKNDIGQSALTIFLALTSILVCGWLVKKRGIEDNTALILVAALIVGFGVYFGWVNPIAYFVALLGGISAMVWKGGTA